jgi:hypothetical protein
MKQKFLVGAWVIALTVGSLAGFFISLSGVDEQAQPTGWQFDEVTIWGGLIALIVMAAIAAVVTFIVKPETRGMWFIPFLPIVLGCFLGLHAAIPTATGLFRAQPSYTNPQLIEWGWLTTGCWVIVALGWLGAVIWSADRR